MPKCMTLVHMITTADKIIWVVYLGVNILTRAYLGMAP